LKLDAAEAALKNLDERRKVEEADLRREEDALEARSPPHRKPTSRLARRRRQSWSRRARLSRGGGD